MPDIFETFFIWLPKEVKTNFIILVRDKDDLTTTDITDITEEIIWKLAASVSIGSFTAKLIDEDGTLQNQFEEEDFVEIYADFNDASRLQFKGIIEKIGRNLSIGQDGLFTTLSGRHVARDIIGTNVTASFENIAVSDIALSIIDEFLTGFTTTNVETISDLVTINWSDMPFLEAMVELSNIGLFDFYVDDDNDFHIFLTSSHENDEEAVVFDDNLITYSGLGEDKRDEASRVTVVGENESGLPIVATAINSNATYVNEIVIKDANVKTFEAALEKANAELEISKVAQFKGQTSSFALEQLNPGDAIFVTIPPIDVTERRNAIEIEHRIASGDWFTTLQVQKEAQGVSRILRRRKKSEVEIRRIDNPNKMVHSTEYNFDNDAKTTSHSNTNVSNGFLQLDSGKIDGTWISTLTNGQSNVNSGDFIVVGDDIDNSEFSVSIDGGVTFTGITIAEFRNEIVFAGDDDQIVVKIRLKTDAANPIPRIDSAVFRYK